jgi:hypothetical protein
MPPTPLRHALLNATLAIAAAPIARGGEPVDLLIIAPDAFHETLRDFASFKNARLAAELVSLESILASSGGADDPERLKRYLFARWRDDGAAYALLVGDADVLPVRYMVLDRVTEPAFDFAFYPSDLYYADLARPDGSFDDWNRAKDGFHAAYFGEVRGEKNKTDPINFDGIDYRPDIAVGRWPVSTVEEVRIVAEKTTRYEQRGEHDVQVGGAGVPPATLPSGTAPHRAAPNDAGSTPLAAFIACGGWIENRPSMDAFASTLGDAWTIERRYWHDANTPEAQRTPPPSDEEVVALLNAGAALVVHSGHGADDRWDQSIGSWSIEKMTNAVRPAILLSAGCSTARFATLPPYEPYIDIHGVEHAGTNAGEVFDAPPPPPAPYQRGPHNPTGLGEQLLRAGPNGAVAYVGCNTGSQPCGMTLVEGIIRAIGSASASLPPPSEVEESPRRRGGEGVGQAREREGDALRLGDAWNAAIAHYFDAHDLDTITPTESWYPASIFFQGMKFMLFGDPSLPMPGRPVE